MTSDSKLIESPFLLERGLVIPERMLQCWPLCVAKRAWLGVRLFAGIQATAAAMAAVNRLERNASTVIWLIWLRCSRRSAFHEMA